MIGRFRVLPERDIEETLAVLVDDVADLAPPLCREFRLVRCQDHAMRRILAEIVRRKVFRYEFAFTMTRGQRDNQSRDPPLLDKQ